MGTKVEAVPLDALSGTSERKKFKARRYAVKFNPPCLFLEYEDALKKTRVRAVKINAISETVTADEITRKVIRSFPRVLDASSVKYDQVKNLIQQLISHYKTAKTASLEEGKGNSSEPPKQSTADVTRDGSDEDPDEGEDASDSKSISHEDDRDPRSDSALDDSLKSPDGGSPGGPLDGMDDLLDELKKEMDEGSESPFASPKASRGCLPFSLTPSPQHPAGANAAAGSKTPLAALKTRLPLVTLADSDTDSDSDSESGYTSPEPDSAASSPAEKKPEARSPAPAVAGTEKLSLDLVVSGDLDLNKVSDHELRRAKASMERHFMANQLRPGDPGFEYDLQVDFGPGHEDNDWDASDPSEEEVVESDEPPVDWDEIHSNVKKT